MSNALAATMGVDMDVPVFATTRQEGEALPLEAAESMLTPGARRSGLMRLSEVGPWQEKDARTSR